jgi:beta-lactamase class A
MKKVIPRRTMSAIFLQSLERASASLPGAFAVCAERLDRAAPRLVWNEDTTFPAASVIKIALALEVLAAIDDAALDATERLEVRAEDKVIGSGVLSALDDGLRLSIADLLHLAMTISDNTATNILVSRLGGVAPVNARLASLGLATTRLKGRIFVEGENGEHSPTTARELVMLLRWIHVHAPRVVSLLEKTQTASTVGRGLPDARFPGVVSEVPPITLAYKTGSLRGIVTEAAIVTTPRCTYAVAMLSEGSGDVRPNHENVARVVLGEVSRAVYAVFEGK